MKKKIKESDKFIGGYWGDYWEGFEYINIVYFTAPIKFGNNKEAKIAKVLRYEA